MLKVVTRILLIITVVLFFMPVTAKAENKINIYFFRGEGCPFCAKEEAFLKEMKSKYDNIKIYDYEIWYDSGNRALLEKVEKLFKKNVKHIPFTVIGKNTFEGYSDVQTPSAIEDAIIKYSNGDYCDYVGEMLGIVKKGKDCNIDGNNTNTISKINLPFFGSVDPKTFSLPIITIIFGLLDGFNPCAMWILLFLISILLGMKNRKRMWTLGITFLATSAIIYYLFMAIWLNVALSVGTVFWLRLLIAVVAFIGGIINVKSALKKKDGGCDVVDEKKRGKIFDRIKKFTHEKSFVLAIIGIMALAVSVNIIELFCSASLPVVYSQILSMNKVPTWSYYLYLLLYVIIFMMDDIIVYIIAMKTLKLKGISTKYGTISHLIGGIIMILIGILLALKPGLLTFGG
jgi:glutaredoxin